MTINSKGINERLRVWNGTLDKTSGGLTKNDLMKNKRGLIVSKRAHKAAKERFNSPEYANVKEAFKNNEY